MDMARLSHRDFVGLSDVVPEPSGMSRAHKKALVKVGGLSVDYGNIREGNL